MQIIRYRDKKLQLPDVVIKDSYILNSVCFIETTKRVLDLYSERELKEFLAGMKTQYPLVVKKDRILLRFNRNDATLKTE